MNEVRLKKAMHLLKSGNYSAAEVADAVGFSDYNHFGRLFRRYYQCTPMEAVGNPRARVQSVRVEVQESKPSKSDHKKRRSSGCKIGKRKEEIAESYERVAKEVYLSFVLFIKM